ncbi:RHS repeat domain-containing protein [Phnomibacter sp. MR]|uniref:RHS repeat domain-containing protein n=1 Tax=Phnomibacter sp. MR TaxID=3042318 RepID=UPI003A809770
MALSAASNDNCISQTFRYNSKGNVIEIIDLNGVVTNYEYDNLGNRIKSIVLTSFCPVNTKQFTSTLAGTKFQWQVKIDSASAFTPIADNNFYFGTRIDSLMIMNPSTAMVGYKYRCAVTLDGETNYSPEYELRIKAIWKGGADSSWSNAANWECGLVPAEKIDVIIPKGASSPVLSQDARVESVLLKDGEVLKVAPGVKLEITGKPKQ